MPNVNKRKGKYFEDKIAEDYRKIFNLSKLECYRSSNSGARLSLEYTGDITFKDPLRYNLITECKYYKDFSLEHVFPICQSYIEDWINQVFEERQHYKKQFHKSALSLIIASRPYLKHHYVILVSSESELIENKIRFYSKNHNQFFSLISYKDIIDLFKEFKLL